MAKRCICKVEHMEVDNAEDVWRETEAKWETMFPLGKTERIDLVSDSLSVIEEIGKEK